MTRALVTGGAGFIGSHMVDRLVQAGREVRVIDNLSSGEQRLKFLEAAGVSVDRIDIRSEASADLIESFKPDEIYHFAAQMDVRRSVADPIYDADVNVLGTLRIVGAAAKVGARVLSASSGGCIYGEADATRFPLDEQTPKNPDSPYGITKSVMEDYLRFYRSIEGLQYANLALGNVYGPRQDPAGEAGVVAIFGLRLLKGEPCYIFGDGSQTRDYIFVGDVVEAFFAAASKGDGETFNIGTGIETSVNDLYARLARICGSDAEPLFKPARPGELDRSCLSSAKAASMLGWSPQKDLDRGLAETVDFLRTQLG
ncbi:MAG TPA: NAD-dependent epimerase/dehydratase family protein [Actinomycetota bacterium]|nr:NAD-dependent epimerase/dehydratase family protein [Actinomycetota bacterium]